MPLSASSQRVIDSLKLKGIDTTSLEQQLSSSEKETAFNSATKSLFETTEFNQFSNAQKQREDLLLKTSKDLVKARELAEDKESALATPAIAEIARLEANLEKMGLTEEQIEGIDSSSVVQLEARINELRNPPNPANNINTNDNKNEGNNMDETKVKELVGNSLGASTLISGQINYQLSRFKSLTGRDMTQAEFDDFQNKAWQGLNQGVDVNTTMNTLHKLNEKETELATVAEQARIKQIEDEAVAKYKREHPELSLQDTRIERNLKGSVLGILDKTRNGSSTVNPPNSTVNNNTKDAANPPDKIDNKVEAGAGNNGNHISTSGFKEGEMPYQIRKQRDRTDRARETLQHVEDNNINIYAEM